MQRMSRVVVGGLAVFFSAGFVNLPTAPIVHRQWSPVARHAVTAGGLVVEGQDLLPQERATAGERPRAMTDSLSLGALRGAQFLETAA